MSSVVSDNPQSAGVSTELGAHAAIGHPLVLGISDLLPGDVLLYRARCQNAVQKRISLVTNSPYTHAAIYIGGDEIAESVAWPCLVGVRKTTVKKSIGKSQCVGVLRSQAGFGHDRPTKSHFPHISGVISANFQAAVSGGRRVSEPPTIQGLAAVVA